MADKRYSRLARFMNVPESAFEPKTMTDADRINELENCVLELAEIIGG